MTTETTTTEAATVVTFTFCADSGKYYCDLCTFKIECEDAVYEYTVIGADGVAGPHVACIECAHRSTADLRERGAEMADWMKAEATKKAEQEFTKAAEHRAVFGAATYVNADPVPDYDPDEHVARRRAAAREWKNWL